MAAMQKITPFLWFNSQAEEAANFYVSLFPDSQILTTTRYDEASAKASGQPVGSAMVVNFQLADQDFVALNGGPQFKFTEAISLVINCADQEEVDFFWQKLTEGGEESVCGWLKDKFGLSWQVVPVALSEMLADPDPAKAGRVMEAMLKMKKIDTDVLKQAYDQK
jgi:predicted 3-demethylubiquinone-9 3-methyltransferase (glyoxalase superfamily)